MCAIRISSYSATRSSSTPAHGSSRNRAISTTISATVCGRLTGRSGRGRASSKEPTDTTSGAPRLGPRRTATNTRTSARGVGTDSHAHRTPAMASGIPSRPCWRATTASSGVSRDSSSSTTVMRPRLSSKTTVRCSPSVDQVGIIQRRCAGPPRRIGSGRGRRYIETSEARCSLGGVIATSSAAGKPPMGAARLRQSVVSIFPAPNRSSSKGLNFPVAGITRIRASCR